MRKLLRISLRIAVASVCVLVILLVVLWLMGGRTVVNEVEVAINAPPEVVWEYLTETDRLKQWMDGLAEIEPLTEGGHRVGAKARVILEVEGERYELEDEVLQSEEGSLLEVRLTSPLFVVTNTYRLTRRDGTTDLHQTMQAKYKSWARLLAPFMSGEVQRQLEADFARLKTCVETG